MQPVQTLNICLPCEAPQRKPHHDLCQGWYWKNNGREKVACECLHGGSSGVPHASSTKR